MSKKSSLQNLDESDEGEFLWLISLSDLMLLLFIFFVVLFSFSYSKLTNKDFEKMNAVIKGQKVENSLDKIQHKLLKWVVSRKLLEDIEVVQKEDSLIIQIKEKILFPSGTYQLKDSSREVIELIAKALTLIPPPYRIGIEGHTDNSPLTLKGQNGLDGNWYLASQRALSVLGALKLNKETLKRVVVMSYGPQRPLVPNKDKHNRPIEENLAKNRRVSIRVF